MTGPRDWSPRPTADEIGCHYSDRIIRLFEEARRIARPYHFESDQAEAVSYPKCSRLWVMDFTSSPDYRLTMRFMVNGAEEQSLFEKIEFSFTIYDGTTAKRLERWESWWARVNDLEDVENAFRSMERKIQERLGTAMSEFEEHMARGISLGSSSGKSPEMGQVRKKKRIPLKKAEVLAEKIYDQLLPYCEFLMVTGSIRRRRSETADIDFVALPTDVEEFLEVLGKMGYVGGDRRQTLITKGIKVEIYIAYKPEEIGAMVFTYTGDWLFNVAMRSIAKRRGWKLDQYGLQDAKTGKWILQSPYEEDFFGALGVDYHTPEERSFADRPRGKKASMGTIGPRDWSPRREVPGHEPRFAKILSNISWDRGQWREPDSKDDFSWIWYGPGGKRGGYATELERAHGGWNVSEYVLVEGNVTDLNFLRSTIFVSDEFLSEALYREKGIPVDPEVIEESSDEWGLWAVSLGVADLGYYGGSEEWVESLP